MVTVLPLMVATDELELANVTGSPDAPPVAVIENAALPSILAGKAANVMV
jgi:hypothetical protein